MQADVRIAARRSFSLSAVARHSRQVAFYCLKDELLFQQQRPFDDTVNGAPILFKVAPISSRRVRCASSFPFLSWPACDSEGLDRWPVEDQGSVKRTLRLSLIMLRKGTGGTTAPYHRTRSPRAANRFLSWRTAARTSSLLSRNTQQCYASQRIASGARCPWCSIDVRSLLKVPPDLDHCERFSRYG